jgi:hypothetical protein
MKPKITWKLEGSITGRPHLIVERDGKEMDVAVLFNEDIAMGQHIAHCLNHFDEMLEALKELKQFVVPYAVPRDAREMDMLSASEKAKVAIAKAEGREP